MFIFGVCIFGFFWTPPVKNSKLFGWSISRLVDQNRGILHHLPGIEGFCSWDMLHFLVFFFDTRLMVVEDNILSQIVVGWCSNGKLQYFNLSRYASHVSDLFMLRYFELLGLIGGKISKLAGKTIFPVKLSLNQSMNINIHYILNLYQFYIILHIISPFFDWRNQHFGWTNPAFWSKPPKPPTFAEDTSRGRTWLRSPFRWQRLQRRMWRS